MYYQRTKKILSDINSNDCMMYILYTYIVDDCNERGGVNNLLRAHWIQSSLSTMTAFHCLLSLHKVYVRHMR